MDQTGIFEGQSDLRKIRPKGAAPRTTNKRPARTISARVHMENMEKRNAAGCFVTATARSGNWIPDPKWATKKYAALVHRARSTYISMKAGKEVVFVRRGRGEDAFKVECLH